MGIIVINAKKNANTKIIPNLDCAHMLDQHLSVITLKEFSRAANSFPIVLVKSKDSSQFSTAVMFGLQQGENLFYNKENWRCNYAPLSILSHPFILGRDENDPIPNRLTACLLDDSKFVSETEGKPLFNADGTPTELYRQHNSLLNELFNNEKETFAFIQKMTELDLIVPFTLETVRNSGSKKQLTGLHLIDNNRLKALPDDVLLDLQKKEYLRSIYAMDISMSNFVTMVKMKNETEADPIVSCKFNQ